MMRACGWLTRTSASVCGFAALVVVAAIATGCGRPIQVEPYVIEDAQLGARVKTALVNDAQLGIRVIEVRVTRGVVTLSGLVGSAAESARAVEIARTVQGVAEVRSLLAIRDPIELGATDALDVIEPPARTSAAELSPGRRPLFASGASFNARHPSDSKLDSWRTVGPLVWLRTGRRLRSRSASAGPRPSFSGPSHARCGPTPQSLVSASSARCSREDPHECAT